LPLRDMSIPMDEGFFVSPLCLRLGPRAFLVRLKGAVERELGHNLHPHMQRHTKARHQLE
ncbi:tyrosine recombinase XerC, partial [Pseudomonas syringae pv. tagetis]